MEISVILTAQCRMDDRGWMIDYPQSTTSRADHNALIAFTFRSPEETPEWEREKPDCLVFSTASPLEEECAREILSLFMLSICGKVESVRGETNSEHDGMMTNTTFKGIAEKIVQVGLAKTPNDALLYVIPAFAKFGLLPRFENDKLVTSRRENIGYSQIVKSELRSRRTDRSQR